MHLINLILIQWIVVFIIDISGVVDNLKSLLMKILTKGKIDSNNYRLKPFDCSLCTTFWVGLIYLLCTSQFTIAYIAFICVLSASTPITLELFNTIYDLTIKLMKWINH